MRLNLGSHNKRFEGFTNVDIQPLEGVDIIHDLTQFPWPFETGSIDKILAQEFLEHLEVRFALPVLVECRRILKPGGDLNIQVPDIEAMCRMINRQCVCVPRKAARYEDYKSDPNCFNCSGKGLIHPERWHVAFTGAQKHPWDIHRNHFTPAYLESLLSKAGFVDLKRTPNIYKLVYLVKKT